MVFFAYELREELEVRLEGDPCSVKTAAHMKEEQLAEEWTVGAYHVLDVLNEVLFTKHCSIVDDCVRDLFRLTVAPETHKGVEKHSQVLSRETRVLYFFSIYDLIELGLEGDHFRWLFLLHYAVLVSANVQASQCLDHMHDQGWPLEGGVHLLKVCKDKAVRIVL
jgi:hypothetical protein